jgi:hypothetical protein
MLVHIEELTNFLKAITIQSTLIEGIKRANNTSHVNNDINDVELDSDVV